MAKPILVIYTNEINKDRLADSSAQLEQMGVTGDYHVLIVFSKTPNVQVFFEKDQIELDKDKLEALLSLCK